MPTIERNKKDTYQQRAQARFNKLNAQIEAYKARGQQVKAEATIQYYDRLADLQVKRDTAQRQLNGIRESGEEAWQDLRLGFEQAWSDLLCAFQRVQSSR